MANQTQKQEGGDNSTNFQANVINVSQGLTVADVKVIANDLFKDNFIQLKKDALVIAMGRSNEITEMVIERLRDVDPAFLMKFWEPGIQYSFYNVQKEYAKSGDPDLAVMLLMFLINRLESTEKSFLQISFDQAIQIVPKLTDDQLNLMALNFCMTRPLLVSPVDLAEFSCFLNEYIFPFARNAAVSRLDNTHIVALGCGILSSGHYDPVCSFFRKHYGGLFQTGFDQESLEKLKSIEEIEPLIMDCFHDGQKKQLGVLNYLELKNKLDQLNAPNEVRKMVNDTFYNAIMGVGPLKEYLTTVYGDTGILLKKWDEAETIHLELTSLGEVIAHTFIKSRVKEWYRLKF